MKKFLDDYLKGECVADDIKQYIINISSQITDEEICANLGLTQDEYNTWKEYGSVALEDLLHVKKIRLIIVENAKKFFREEIAENHLKNTRKLESLKYFNLNPFLDKYIANFLTGNDDPESIAKALIYPRVLGTSINTTFGTKLQKFCSEVLDGFASVVSGIDIEFVDMVDGRRKYCQIKAGPNTINKDDVDTINRHFQGIKNLARTNGLDVGYSDLIVGVFYGLEDELSTHYRNLSKTYPVYIGKKFWFRLTGDAEFYNKLTDAIGDVATEYDGREVLDRVIGKLAKQIEENLKK